MNTRAYSAYCVSYRILVPLGLCILLIFFSCPRASVLQELERDLTSLLGRISPNIVTVQAVFKDQVQGRRGRSDVLNTGTGFVVDPNGYIITSINVVNEPASLPYNITVVDQQDSSHAAMLFGVDNRQNIAILWVPELTGGAELPRREVEWYQGQMAIVIGNSFGTGPSVSLTSVTGQRQIDGAWLLNSPITPGMSGSPVFDTGGRWGGVILGGAANQRGNNQQQMSPAVMEAVRQLSPILDRISRLSEVEQRPWLGLRVGTRVDDNGQMIIHITGVFDNSPASRSGVEDGDVIIGLDNYPVYYMLDFAEALQRLTVGQTATLHVLRDGQPRSVTITVDQR